MSLVRMFVSTKAGPLIAVVEFIARPGNRPDIDSAIHGCQKAFPRETSTLLQAREIGQAAVCPYSLVMVSSRLRMALATVVQAANSAGSRWGSQPDSPTASNSLADLGLRR
jgi:hypothetical protein